MRRHEKEQDGADDAAEPKWACGDATGAFRLWQGMNVSGLHSE
jgi:hypothetical protein